MAVSDINKLEYSKYFGVDFERLLKDRLFKESHR